MLNWKEELIRIDKRGSYGPTSPEQIRLSLSFQRLLLLCIYLKKVILNVYLWERKIRIT